MLLDQRTYLPEDILVKLDRTSMLNSLEARVPMLDHHIIDFANSLPIGLKINGMQQKQVVRNLLLRYMPKDFVDRKKQGFGLPLKDWFMGRYRDKIRELLVDSATTIGKYLNVGEVAGLVEAHQRGHRDFSPKIWSLLWLELWLQNAH